MNLTVATESKTTSPICGNNDQRWCTEVCEHFGIKIALLIVQVTLILGQLGINSNGLQTVSKN